MNLKNLLVLAAIFLSLVVPASASSLEQELARARAATSKYHVLAQAEADGYIQDLCNPGEGCHWFNFDYYLDGNFDPERPEALIYRQTQNGWQLVAVEYIMPGDSTPAPPAPEGFTGDADDAFWRYGSEGFPDWELVVWIWFNNPNGIFAAENPRLEE